MSVRNQPHAPHEPVILQHRLPLQPHPIRQPQPRPVRQSRLPPSAPLRFHLHHAIPERRRQQPLRQHSPLITPRRLPRDKLYERLSRRQQRVVLQQPPRLPEVRVRSAVARIEQPRQLPEVPILPIIHQLVHLPRRSRNRRVLQRGRHYDRCKRSIRQRKMHPRRKQRINEASRIPNQYVPRPRQRPAPVRPVPHHLRLRHHLRAFQHPRKVWRSRNLRFQEAPRTLFPYPSLSRLRVHHRTHARPALAQRPTQWPTQWNIPQPAVRLRLDQDVSRIRLRQSLPALVVPIHRQVAKELVPLQ